MKTFLYGTTALVATSLAGAGTAAAEGIELGLGGYLHTLFSVGGIDEADGSDADYNPTGLWSDGEIWFKGSYKHDNGITFGVQVEMEATSTSDQIDERYITVDGDFGRIIAGSENSAAYLMQYVAPYAGIPINSGWQTVFIPAPAGYQNFTRSPGGATYLDIGNDENLITYFTPRFAGFQLGISYIPAVNNSGDGQNFPVEGDTNSQYTNGVSVGANYVESFNGVGLAVAAGYRRAQVPDSLDDYFDDYQSISAGINVSYAGFTVGGSYANVLDGGSFGGRPADIDDLSSNEGQAWDAGVTYGTGPWLFGVTYFQGKTDAQLSVPGSDELTSIEGGVNYKVGPGITARGAILWSEYDEEENGTQSGVVGIAGLSFNF